MAVRGALSTPTSSLQAALTQLSFIKKTHPKQVLFLLLSLKLL
uniref:Salt-induced S3 n=1 Tax=Halogeton glomeratus TaxID=454499 RepID=A0A1P8LI10_9CARY|nr:salt-induced S3 [Halogeton glomeratus]